MGLVEEDVEAEVVAVEGDAPGAGGGGDAEEDEVVRVLVADTRGADELDKNVGTGCMRDDDILCSRRNLEGNIHL